MPKEPQTGKISRVKNTIAETNYPVKFRKEDSTKLGNFINSRRSVVLVGMKRIGIFHFLRFFLHNKKVIKTYVKDRNHMFIPVDLNDMVEREIFPFWILTFKRIADEVEKSKISKKIKKQIANYFLDSIQTQDLFLTIEYIRKSLLFLTAAGINPTIFFLRFDRLRDSATADLFDNFQGLADATHRRLSYVFTSVRSFDTLFPRFFNKNTLSYFSNTIYVKPNNAADSKVVLENYLKQGYLSLSKSLEDELLRLVDGHSQYLHFALISLHEFKDSKKMTKNELWNFLTNDERISLQSEELWESLEKNEQDILLKVFKGKHLNAHEIKSASYLFNCGFLNEKTKKIFNPLFEYFIETKEKERQAATSELSNKEFLLLNFLEKNENSVCEREQIVEAVWPEEKALGVSDWAIDRLVARLRVKLKNQNGSNGKNQTGYEIVTIKTRGYKLTKF